MSNIKNDQKTNFAKKVYIVKTQKLSESELKKKIKNEKLLEIKRISIVINHMLQL